MQYEKNIPRTGDRLLHRFQNNRGEAIAEVISVDERTGKIAVRVGNLTYPSLSSAGKAVSGHSTNGWIFWGLKKQISYRGKNAD